MKKTEKEQKRFKRYAYERVFMEDHIRNLKNGAVSNRGFLENSCLGGTLKVIIFWSILPNQMKTNIKYYWEISDLRC